MNTPSFELIFTIVNHGMGSRLLHRAKEHGIHGGTILLGKGTVRNAFLNFLSLYDEQKEIVLMGADRKTAAEALGKLDREFQFAKPHHGIAFTTSICSIAGSDSYQCEEPEAERGADKPMYQSIIAIVDRGRAEDVIEAAAAAGSKGGTIINARGSGVHETSKLFNINIEPEKEMVMILSRKDAAEAIVSSIRERLNLSQPGNGIIFIQDVNQVYGIYE